MNWRRSTFLFWARTCIVSFFLLCLDSLILVWLCNDANVLDQGMFAVRCYWTVTSMLIVWLQPWMPDASIAVSCKLARSNNNDRRDLSELLVIWFIDWFLPSFLYTTKSTWYFKVFNRFISYLWFLFAFFVRNRRKCWARNNNPHFYKSPWLLSRWLQVLVEIVRNELRKPQTASVTTTSRGAYSRGTNHCGVRWPCAEAWLLVDEASWRPVGYSTHGGPWCYGWNQCVRRNFPFAIDAFLLLALLQYGGISGTKDLVVKSSTRTLNIHRTIQFINQSVNQSFEQHTE